MFKIQQTHLLIKSPTTTTTKSTTTANTTTQPWTTPTKQRQRQPLRPISTTSKTIWNTKLLTSNLLWIVIAVLLVYPPVHGK